MTDCTNHADVLRRLENVEVSMKSLSEKVHNVEKNSVKDDERIKAIFTIVEGLKVSIDGISQKLDKIAGRSGARWEGMVDKIIAAVAGGIIVYLFSMLK